MYERHEEYYNVLAGKVKKNTYKGSVVRKWVDGNQDNGVWVKKIRLENQCLHVKILSLFFHRIRFNG